MFMVIKRKIPLNLKAMHVTGGNFPCNLSQQMYFASWEKDFTCNTPFLQPAMQQNIALQVARKVELSSTFCNIARQGSAYYMSFTICNAIL